MTFPKIKMVAAVMALFVLQSCVESSEKEDKEDNEITEVEQETDQSSVVNVSGNLFSIPSPVETALLIESSGADYDASLPNAPQNLSNYISETDKGLVMGVYGADLAYSSIFEKNQEALSYLGAVEKLATDLDLINAVDQSIVKRFSQNMGNRDSMLVLSSSFFRSTDLYLKENKRDDIATLVLIGGWVEGMYLAYNSVEGNEAVRQRIAEQKKSLENIVELTNELGDKVQVGPLQEKLMELNKTFEGIESTYEFQRPETDAAKKLTTLKSTTTFNMSEEQLNEVGNQLEVIRNHIVG